MKSAFFIQILLTFSFHLNAHQLLYPIAQQTDGTVLLLHQIDSSHTQLFSWDPETGAMKKVLAQRHTPVGITCIPGSTTFSFIDNGRIRIKQSTKRSAYALASDIPLYNIGPVSWANTYGFFSAKEQGNHALYRTDLKGNVTCVACSPGVDYLYPSCTDTCLFYITRRVDDRVAPRCPKHAQCRCRPINPVDAFLYSINMIPFNNIDVVGHETIKDFDGRGMVRETFILKERECPLVFLTMISDTYGFVLEHDPVLAADAPGITMRCHHIYKDDTNSWALSYLFSYTIPTALVVPGSSERLLEGFLPFVPRYKSGTFYFVDYKEDGLASARRSLPSRSPDKRRGGVYSYEVETGKVMVEVAPSVDSLYCAPLPITTSRGNYLIYGSILLGEPSNEFLYVKAV